MPPNVLLLVFDSARRDAFEPYGAGPGSSPVVADLARRGAALPHAFATACWTIPSHASIFTGLLPRAAGLARAPGGRPHGCREVLEAQASRMLPEVMRHAGYRTAAASANLWITRNSGFATGFDEFVFVDVDRQARMPGSDLRSRARWAREYLRPQADDGAGKVEATLERWLDGRGREPFFWFVNLVEAHSPYVPPSPYNPLSSLERLRAADDARRYLTLESIWRACVGGLDVPEAALDRMRRLYRGAIRYLDDWLGRILERLDERGLLDETLVIVTSDHGEALGEGGSMCHALALDDRLIHVPFVAAGPGTPAAEELLSLCWLPALIAGAAGLAEHPWSADSAPDRIAIAELDPPVLRDDPRAREWTERWGLGDEALERLTGTAVCATDGRFKLIRRGGGELLYDLRSDPDELSPLPVDHLTEPEARRRLERLRKALDEQYPGAGPPPAVPPGAASPPDGLEEIEERMRLLGYL